MKSTLYFKEKGPICYEAELFENGNSFELDALIESLLSSALNWYWASDRQFEAIEEFKEWSLPQTRYLTQLTNETSKSLHQDFLEEDTDMRRRTVELYGIEFGQTISTKADLSREVTEFLAEGDSVIHCVVVQINDTDPQYIFVPLKPSKQIRGLLDRWELSKETAQAVREYKHLYLAQLESMAKGLIEAAFDEAHP